MHIITEKRLKEFWLLHPAAEAPMREWGKRMTNNEYQNFNALRADFPSADYVRPYTVFNIGGNKFRLVVHIRYDAHKVYVRGVWTHSEYDVWCKQYRKGEGSR
jgi:mRNA interferase HigB